MWMGLRDNIDPAIAAISVLLIAVVIVVILTKTLIATLAAKRGERA
jgi:putative spermidine/putrescine transport system permease protein